MVLLPPVHDYLVDVNGDVWRLRCTCPMHVRGPGQRGHEARPVGNLIEHPELAEHLALAPTPRRVA